MAGTNLQKKPGRRELVRKILRATSIDFNSDEDQIDFELQQLIELSLWVDNVNYILERFKKDGAAQKVTG